MRRLRPRIARHPLGRRRRRDPTRAQRVSLILLGRRALLEIERHPTGESPSSEVFEDGLRYYPELVELADLIQESRTKAGINAEMRYLQQAIDRLERRPLDRLIQRATASIIPILNRAWKRGLFTWQDESFSPFVLHMDRHIRRAVERVQTGLGKRQLRLDISEAFSDRPSVQRLATRVADAIYDVAHQPLDD